jgi:hypothetical protein
VKSEQQDLKKRSATLFAREARQRGRASDAYGDSA